MYGSEKSELTLDIGSERVFSSQEAVIINNNNLLLGGSITKSGLHRGPNIRYILR